MSEASVEAQGEQCIALTSRGERCSRPAQDDGFCFQHDSDDPTIEDASGDGSGDAEGSNEATSEESAVGASDGGDLRRLRERVEATARGVIGRPLDGIVGMTADEDGWFVVVDCLERKAIPDTQDILGQYELRFTEDGAVEGYTRRRRYRRGETVEDDVSPRRPGSTEAFAPGIETHQDEREED